MLELVTTVFTALIGVLGTLGAIWLKDNLNNKKRPDMVTETLALSEIITNKIEYIREDVEADRVWITQFHNGGHFYPTGKSMAKFSVIYESVSTGVSSIQSNFQNIPVNLFSKSLNKLATEELIEISNYQDKKIATYGLKYAAEVYGGKSGYLFAIKNIEGRFIGVLGLDYTKKPVSLSEETVNTVMLHASSLGGVLMNHLGE
tara:strand:+ start:1392 stop:2000 length:609 start_codon:yes stop_codon:yes gene_type:complete